MNLSKSFPIIGTVVLASCLLPSSATAAPGDEHWDARFGWPGPGGNSLAVAANGNRIYVSGLGQFLTNAPLTVWDGAQWFPQDQFYGTSVVVYDLGFLGNTLYAVGQFTNVDGVAANGFAQWDGTSWTGLPISGIGVRLAFDGANVYVGGTFANPGGVTATNVGYWDGSNWHALGDGLGKGPAVDLIRAVIATNGQVYAAGTFTNSGNAAVTNLAFWNGVAWSAIGGGFPGTINALGLSGNNLYVGGTFSQAGTTPANNIALWNGSTWTALGTGVNGNVSSIVIFSNQVDVMGSFTIAGGVPATNFAIWNGSVWSAAPGGGLSTTGARGISTGTNVYVAGNFLLAGGLIMNGLASWDGAQWIQVGTPGFLEGVGSTVAAVATDGSNIYAGGLFSGAGQTNAAAVARFDGSNWFPLGGGVSGNSSFIVNAALVNAIALDQSNVYVGGTFRNAGGLAANQIASWDGNNWHTLGSGPGGIVFAIALQSNYVYAAGAPVNGSAYGSPFFMRWDGSSWQNPLKFPTNTFFSVLISSPTVGMDALAFVGTNLYLGGYFNFAQCDPLLMNCTNCNNILRFDGTYAWVVGTNANSGPNSNVVALAALGTNLFAAGNFTTIGGISVSHIARWDGNNWWDVGGGIVGKGTILSLTAVGNDLYAGGSFTNIGGIAANRIAKWDGTNWSALGSGLTIPGIGSGATEGLAGFGNDLYAGGTFRSAGGKPSFQFAHWNDQINFNVPQLVNPAWSSNQQFRVRLVGINGVTNLIEASTNLQSWTPVLTNSTGVYDFTDTTSSNYLRRFYRALLGL